MPPSGSGPLGHWSILVLESNQQLFTLLPNSFSGVPSSSSCVPTLCKGILKGSVLHHQVYLLYLAQLLPHKTLLVDICQIMLLSCSTSNPACLSTEPICIPGRLGRGLRCENGKCPCSVGFISLKEDYRKHREQQKGLKKNQACLTQPHDQKLLSTDHGALESRPEGRPGGVQGSQEGREECGSWSNSDNKPRCRGPRISKTARPFRQARCCTWRDGGA